MVKPVRWLYNDVGCSLIVFNGSKMSFKTTLFAQSAAYFYVQCCVFKKSWLLTWRFILHTINYAISWSKVIRERTSHNLRFRDCIHSWLLTWRYNTRLISIYTIKTLIIEMLMLRSSSKVHVQVTFGISHQNWDFCIRRKPIFVSLSVQNVRPKWCWKFWNLEEI